MVLINCAINLIASRGNRRLFSAQMGESNFAWLKYLTEEDFCVFSDGTGPASIEFIEKILANVPVRENFFFICNERKIFSERLSAGIPNTLFINQNAFINENLFNIVSGLEKDFDAVYNARLRPVKRHYLASEVGENLKLALVVGHHTGVTGNISEIEVPKNVFRNNTQLSKLEVVNIINRSKVGLILSKAEGGCFASSEYLLCGTPVVSSFCSGGRQEWYNKYNSISVSPDPASVKEAVTQFLDEPRDPFEVRRTHLEMMYSHRQKYIDHIILKVFPELYAFERIDEIFSLFDAQRYIVFQGGGAWKKPDETIEIFEHGGFDPGVDVNQFAKDL